LKREREPSSEDSKAKIQRVEEKEDKVYVNFCDDDLNPTFVFNRSSILKEEWLLSKMISSQITSERNDKGAYLIKDRVAHYFPLMMRLFDDEDVENEVLPDDSFDFACKLEEECDYFCLQSVKNKIKRKFPSVGSNLPRFDGWYCIEGASFEFYPNGRLRHGSNIGRFSVVIPNESITFQWERFDSQRRKVMNNKAGLLRVKNPFGKEALFYIPYSGDTHNVLFIPKSQEIPKDISTLTKFPMVWE